MHEPQIICDLNDLGLNMLSAIYQKAVKSPVW